MAGGCTCAVAICGAQACPLLLILLPRHSGPSGSGHFIEQFTSTRATARGALGGRATRMDSAPLNGTSTFACRGSPIYGAPVPTTTRFGPAYACWAKLPDERCADLRGWSARACLKCTSSGQYRNGETYDLYGSLPLEYRCRAMCGCDQPGQQQRRQSIAF